METLISLGYWVSSLGFLIATYVTFNAFRKAPRSGLKTVLSYLFIGTGAFFIITVFQKLVVAGFYNIADDSQDIWWHLMFYIAMISYYLGFRTLARLGATETTNTEVSTAKSSLWGYFSLFLLVLIFFLPNASDSVVTMYTSSRLAGFGLHHFIAFILAGVIGAYLFMAKLLFGQIGKAVAGPMIIALWAFALQHAWELLFESWKMVIVTTEVGEGVERIFLIIASVSIVYAALRLQSFTRATAS